MHADIQDPKIVVMISFGLDDRKNSPCNTTLVAQVFGLFVDEIGRDTISRFPIHNLEGGVAVPSTFPINSMRKHIL